MEHEENYNQDQENEIAKIHADIDIERERERVIIQLADLFYQQLKNLSVGESISHFKSHIIKNNIAPSVEMQLKNMISVFESTEEYEKCHKILKIKKELFDDKF